MHMMSNENATTATAYASPGLNARVEILRPITTDFVEVRVISGVGGWARVGKVFGVRRSILSEFGPTVVESAPEVETYAPVPIAEPMPAEDYMNVLVSRQEAWKLANARNGVAPRLSPLLESFILAGEEDLVILPESAPAPRRVRQPRRYRSAASLREERDKLEARMAQVAGVGDDTDPAVVNLSPYSRSRAARNAGRQRFARLDRDLAEYARLRTLRDALNGRIARAEERERRAG